MSPEHQDILRRIIYCGIGKQAEAVTPAEMKDIYSEAICNGDVALAVPVRPQSAFRAPNFSREWDNKEISHLLYKEICDDFKSPPHDKQTIHDYFEVNYTQAAFFFDRETGMVACIFDYQKSDIYTATVMDLSKFCTRYAAYVRDSLDRMEHLTQGISVPVDAVAICLAQEKQKAIISTINVIERVTGVAVPHPLRGNMDASARLQKAVLENMGRKPKLEDVHTYKELAPNIAKQCIQAQKFNWN